MRSTLLVDPGLMTALTRVRVATSSMIVRSGRSISPPSSWMSTSRDVESICTCSPGRETPIAAKGLSGRLARERRVFAEPAVMRPRSRSVNKRKNVRMLGSGTTPAPCRCSRIWGVSSSKRSLVPVDDFVWDDITSARAATTRGSVRLCAPVS